MNRHYPSDAALYIHIPFCRAKCFYCDFCSGPLAGGPEAMERYICRLIEEYCARRPQGHRPSTVYIGGGTPSLLPHHLLDRILAEIDTSVCREFTIEANPEDITPEWAEMIAATGCIDRVSVGIQSFDDSELKAVGRRHTAARASEAVSHLRHAGICNLSLDLIYGLPGQTDDSWLASLNQALDMRPEHLSCYLLSIEPGTRLNARLSRGLISELPPEQAELRYTTLRHAAASAGYEHYEISNFALPGLRARHNSAYWHSAPYLGIGVGAHSLDADSRRSFNRAAVGRYIDAGFTATLTPDPETDHQRFNDFIITRLRTADGLSLDECIRLFGAEWTDRLLRDASGAMDRGSLILDEAERRLTIPPDRWLISDAIMLDLIHA